MGLKSQVLDTIQTLKDVTHRNSLIIKTVTSAFFIILVAAIALTIIVFNMSPDLLDSFSSFTQSVLGYGDIPLPYTGNLFSYIFSNNVGHFWNPIRMIVWIPVLGPLLLWLEVLLNSGLIGVVAVIVGVNNGVAYPIIGLVPHGLIEIPAFLFQLSAIVLWQVTVSEAIITKLRGNPLERTKINQAIRDIIILATVSIILMAVAAVIETYVTPYLLGL